MRIESDVKLDFKDVLIRLLGENPFIVAMLVTPVPQHIWGTYMYWWAVAILGWAVLTSFGGPLRILGPGFHYMKASVFPSAYALAVTIGATLLVPLLLWLDSHAASERVPLVQYVVRTLAFVAWAFVISQPLAPYAISPVIPALLALLLPVIGERLLR